VVYTTFSQPAGTWRCPVIWPGRAVNAPAVAVRLALPGYLAGSCGEHGACPVRSTTRVPLIGPRRNRACRRPCRCFTTAVRPSLMRVSERFVLMCIQFRYRFQGMVSTEWSPAGVIADFNISRARNPTTALRLAKKSSIGYF
jgi:hypothetical protein